MDRQTVAYNGKQTRQEIISLRGSHTFKGNRYQYFPTRKKNIWEDEILHTTCNALVNRNVQLCSVCIRLELSEGAEEHNR